MSKRENENKNNEDENNEKENNKIMKRRRIKIRFYIHCYNSIKALDSPFIKYFLIQ